ncbi:FAD-dependent oxidoreductase [Arthrobacter sp. USHLN218]|uniref:FAD-dependent oxidoreductase n=1 Tax=Arthrobacter sp. USHLN218 TaxID=3081232 RepID=UPI00301B210A
MYDVIVIGAGLTGAAAAWSLSQRGRSVLVLEANDLNHNQGSSHGTSRIFRRSISSPKYAALAERAQYLWRKVESQSGQELLTITGSLDFGEVRNPSALFAAATANGVACELLTAEAAQERWPNFRFTTDVMFHADAGTLNPEAAIRALLEVATAQYGAELLTNTRVVGIEELPGRVQVRTVGRTYSTRSVVVAAGPWLPELLPHLFPEVGPVQVSVHEQNVFHFPQLRAEDRWPVFVYKGHAQFFALPSGADGGPSPAIKIGRHDPGREVTPAHRDGVPTAENRELISEFVREHLPGLESEPVAEDTGLYTITRNDDFIMDRIGRITVASPCSGQGAKFMPAVGELLADIVLENAPIDEDFALMSHLQARSGPATVPIG